MKDYTSKPSKLLFATTRCCHSLLQDKISMMHLLKDCNTEGLGQGMIIPSNDHRFRRINALHPGYASNHMNFDSSFRRPLILKFSRAIAIWGHCWIEQPNLNVNYFRTPYHRLATEVAESEISWLASEIGLQLQHWSPREKDVYSTSSRRSRICTCHHGADWLLPS